MKALEQLDRFKRLNELIKKESTGSPVEFAELLGISRRQLYADIEYLKDLGLNIEYSKVKSSFYFSGNKELEISYCFKVLSKNVIEGINGGNIFDFFHSAFFLHSQRLIWY